MIKKYCQRLLMASENPMKYARTDLNHKQRANKVRKPSLVFKMDWIFFMFFLVTKKYFAAGGRKRWSLLWDRFEPECGLEPRFWTSRKPLEFQKTSCAVRLENHQPNSTTTAVFISCTRSLVFWLFVLLLVFVMSINRQLNVFLFVMEMTKF